MFSRLPYLSMMSVAYLPRGPVPTVEELEEIKKFCVAEKAIFLKIEPHMESSFNHLLRVKVGKSILPQHTIFIDLNLSEEKLLTQMHEKTRYNMRLAQKKGVVVREENSTEGLEGFIKLLNDTERRQGFYSHNGEYYRKLWKALRPSGMVYLLSAYPPTRDYGLQSTAIASIMLFRFKEVLYYSYGGSDPNFRQYMAPNLLHWEAIKLGKKLGCKTYDLWGSFKDSKTDSDPWWGIYRFKSGFGGKEADFPQAIDIPLSPLYQPLMLGDSLRWFLLKFLKKLR